MNRDRIAELQAGLEKAQYWAQSLQAELDRLKTPPYRFVRTFTIDIDERDEKAVEQLLNRIAATDAQAFHLFSINIDESDKVICAGCDGVMFDDEFEDHVC